MSPKFDNEATIVETVVAITVKTIEGLKSEKSTTMHKTLANCEKIVLTEDKSSLFAANVPTEKSEKQREIIKLTINRAKEILTSVRRCAGTSKTEFTKATKKTEGIRRIRQIIMLAAKTELKYLFAAS